MSERDPKTLHAGHAGLWTRAAFWDEVEVEIEALDWRDFREFLAADRLPCRADPQLRRQLREALRRLVVARYSH